MANPTKTKVTYRVDEVARLLGLSRNAAYEAVTRGEIPSLRFGRRIVIPRLAFERLLEARTGAGTL